jgi:pimeloyl-ACP methyl ester carboxylesterase
MPFYDRGPARIHYQVSGSGFPLFIIYGGGLNSALVRTAEPIDAVAEFAAEYRCISMDLRNSNRGQSTGPLEVEQPWDMYTDDQLGLLDHLSVERFLVLGFCIGNPLIWNLLRRAGERVVAAVSAQPSAINPVDPSCFYERNLAKWGPELHARQPQISLDQIERFLRRMYTGVDFVITASREFVSQCQTPLLVLPDDTLSHPYELAIEMAHLAPQAQLSLYPWRDTPKNTELAVRHMRTFLRAYRPAR